MIRHICLLVICGVCTIAIQSNELLASEPLESSAAKIVAESNNRFAINLYSQLSSEQPTENLFFSPYSVSSALMMAAEGARRQTGSEIAKTLCVPSRITRFPEGPNQRTWDIGLIHRGYKQLNDRFNAEESDEVKVIRAEVAAMRKQLAASNAIVEKSWGSDKVDYDRLSAAENNSRKLAAKINALEEQISDYELNVANALWCDRRFAIQPQYADTISKYYGTGGVQQVDFQNDYPAAARLINRWAEQQTNQRIKNLLPEYGDPMTRLVLTNAIYFKGDWAEPFEEKRTKDLPFSTASGAEVNTPLMYGRVEQGSYAAFDSDGKFFNTPLEVPLDDDEKQPPRYPDADGFAMAELIYKGEEISMVLVAPNSPDGLPAVEKLLDSQQLDSCLSQLKQREMRVYLPKFKMDASYSMVNTLQALGMNLAFERPSKGGADFSGISSSENPLDQLWITGVIHKTFIEVNEKGTEAAAATAIPFAAESAPADMVPFTPVFRADRPFLYLIRDNSTGTILFMGRFVRP